MKGLINSDGKLIKLVDGQPKESTEYDPLVVAEEVKDIEHLGKIFKDSGTEVNLEGLRLVELDLEIEKPRKKYTVAEQE